MTGSAIWFDFLPSDFHRHQVSARNRCAAPGEVETANASKTRFLANMSHFGADAVERHNRFFGNHFRAVFRRSGQCALSDYSCDILRSGRHLLAVINDVLDLSKSEAGKMVLAVRENRTCAMC
jgi:two-component system cell cycle sensor histidine kinase PleC